jgi:hypothetical protein
MKALLILCATTLVTVTSCNKSAVNPASEKKTVSSLTQQNLSANNPLPFNNQTDIDLSQGYYDINFCTGENVQIVSGIWHIDYHGMISGNHILIDQHSNIQNYKLVSSSGIEYTGSYTSNYKYEGTFNNGQFAFDQSVSVRLTTPGGQNNSVSTFVVHETINANGIVTASVGHFGSGCQ